MSWKPEVKIIGEGGKWSRNGLVFATREEAEASARNLMSRWFMVWDTRATESDEVVNYRWADNGLEAVATVTE